MNRLLIAVLPWTIRNASVSGHFVPVHTSLGVNLYQGEAVGNQWLPFSTRQRWPARFVMSDSVVAPLGLVVNSPWGDAVLIRRVLTKWMGNPLMLLRHFTANALTFWHLAETPLKSGPAIALQLPRFYLGFRRLPSTLRPYPASHISLIVVLYFWVLHTFIFGWVRFSVPVIPMLILIAVAAIRAHGNHRIPQIYME